MVSFLKERLVVIIFVIASCKIYGGAVAQNGYICATSAASCLVSSGSG